VTQALTSRSADRSADTMRIAAACFDAGLSLAQTRWAVRSGTDLAERLDEFAARRKPIDDVAVCLSKIAPGLMPSPTLSIESTDTNGQPAPVAPEPPTGHLQEALDVFGRWLHLEDPAARRSSWSIFWIGCVRRRCRVVRAL
jgi:hypothetical protein